MNQKISSAVLGTIYLVFGWLLAKVTPRFAIIFDDLYKGEELPVLTRLVLNNAKYGVILAIAAGAYFLGRILFPHKSKIPTWPFTLLLLILSICLIAGLSLPLFFIITNVN